MMTKKERKEKEDQSRNCTKREMESVEIDPKRSNVGSNIEIYNGQKLTIEL